MHKNFIQKTNNVKQCYLVVFLCSLYSIPIIIHASNNEPKTAPIPLLLNTTKKRTLPLLIEKQEQKKSKRELYQLKWNITDSSLAQRREKNPASEILKEEVRKKIKANRLIRLQCPACKKSIFENAQPTCKEHRTLPQ